LTNYIREPINGLTHLAGAILSFVGLLAMVIKASSTTHSTLALSAVMIFGISLILLYSASATYHMVMAKERVIAFLRRLDHSMIFILIAGTYTPYCLISLKGVTGWVLFSIVTVITICGVLFKLIWFNCPRWLSTTIYLAMGWMIMFVVSPLFGSINAMGVYLLLLGGLFYTIGGVIYGTKPTFLKSKYMGFHEIFHIFILLGSLAHFFSIFLFVI
jgi:hemolysin III